MGKHIDLTGEIFTRLTVKDKLGKTSSGQYKYLCECECGNEVIVAGGSLKTGNTKSCGCYSADMARTRLYKHGRSDKSRDDYYDYHREYHIKIKYGLSMDEYNAMIDAQDGKCAICNYMFGQTKGDIHVDHCHTEGHVRGLLCNNCNRAIGLFNEDTESLEQAIQYLQNSLAR